MDEGASWSAPRDPFTHIESAIADAESKISAAFNNIGIAIDIAAAEENDDITAVAAAAAAAADTLSTTVSDCSFYDANTSFVPLV